MLRDNLAGLIEPMCDSAGAHASVVAQKLKNGGMLQVNRVGSRRSEAILAPNFPVEDGRQADKKENGRFCSDHGGSRLSRCLHQKAQKSSDDRPQCLENLRPEGAESTLTENAASPFPAEPRQVQHEAVFLACRTTLSLLVVFAFSLFPKGMKHIWVLVARIFRWVPTEGLPTVRYSLQAVLLCALSPLIIAFCLIPGHPLSLLNKDYWSRTFFLGYAAELVVLYKIGAQREFFKTKEEWISSWRMLRSLAYTVAAPLAFGWIAHRIVEGARSGRRIPVAWLFGQNLSIWGFVGSYALLFLFLTVPLGFNQTYLLWAHKYTQSEEVREGSRSWWKLCFVFVFAPPLLASAIWYWF